LLSQNYNPSGKITYRITTMDTDTPIRNFFRHTEGSKIVWGIVMGFKGRLVEELKYPLYEAMNIENRIKSLVASEVNRVRHDAINLGMIRGLFHEELNKHRGQLDQVTASHHAGLKLASESQLAVFKTQCNTFVDQTLDHGQPQKLTEAFLERKATEHAVALRTLEHAAKVQRDQDSLKNQELLTDLRVQQAQLSDRISSTSNWTAVGFFIVSGISCAAIAMSQHGITR
jgi:hypothetical protein